MVLGKNVAIFDWEKGRKSPEMNIEYFFSMSKTVRIESFN